MINEETSAQMSSWSTPKDLLASNVYGPLTFSQILRSTSERVWEACLMPLKTAFSMASHTRSQD